MAEGAGPGTTVSGGVADLVVMWAGFPLLGAGLGAALAPAAGWLAGLPWVPFRGLFTLLARLPDEHAYPAGAGVAAAVGLAVAYVGTRERLTVTVVRTAVRLHRAGQDREVARAAVAGVFLDGKALVLVGADGGELAREQSDLSPGRLHAAFAGQGWPWLDRGPVAADAGAAPPEPRPAVGRDRSTGSPGRS